MVVRIQTSADATHDQPTTGMTLMPDPEPRALYELIRLTFVPHGPAASTGWCAACGKELPLRDISAGGDEL